MDGGAAGKSVRAAGGRRIAAITAGVIGRRHEQPPVDELSPGGSRPRARAELRCEARRGVARGAGRARSLHKGPDIQQRHVTQEIPMNAIALEQPTVQPSFQTIESADLADVNGGLDLGQVVNAGNANVESGAKAGGALGGAVGAVAGGIAGGTVAGAPTMGLGTVGGVLVGAAAGAPAGATAGAALGGGIGWIGGAASNAWGQITGR
jgi:hypothetical protein